MYFTILHSADRFNCPCLFLLQKIYGGRSSAPPSPHLHSFLPSFYTFSNLHHTSHLIISPLCPLASAPLPSSLPYLLPQMPLFFACFAWSCTVVTLFTFPHPPVVVIFLVCSLGAFCPSRLPTFHQPMGSSELLQLHVKYPGEAMRWNLHEPAWPK